MKVKHIFIMACIAVSLISCKQIQKESSSRKEQVIIPVEVDLRTLAPIVKIIINDYAYNFCLDLASKESIVSSDFARKL